MRPAEKDICQQPFVWPALTHTHAHVYTKLVLLGHSETGEKGPLPFAEGPTLFLVAGPYGSEIQIES